MNVEELSQQVLGRIAELCESAAYQREQRAEAFPEDERNASAARNLRELAEAVRNVPNNHPKLINLIASYEYGKLEADPVRLSPPDNLWRYGFGYTPDSHEAEAIRLIEAVRERVGDFYKFYSDKPNAEADGMSPSTDTGGWYWESL